MRKIGCPHCKESDPSKIDVNLVEKAAICLTCNNPFNLEDKPYRVGAVISVMEFEVDFDPDNMTTEQYDEVVELVKARFKELAEGTNDKVSDMIETSLNLTDPR